MYENFVLKHTEHGEITGYLWPVDQPSTVVCIIHGIGEYAGRYDRVATRLNREGNATISMDLRGHGRTAGLRGHCAPRQSVLEDIDKLLHYAYHRYPDTKIVLYGHSMGGNITLDYRCRGKLNDLPSAYLVTSPWITLVRNIPILLRGLVYGAAKVRPMLSIHSDIDESLLGHPESIGLYNKDELVFNNITLQCAVDGFKTGIALKEGRLEDNGRARNIPTLLMVGSEDRICDPVGGRKCCRRMMKTGDNVGFIEWPGLYHEIHNGGAESKGDEVIEKIADYLTSFRF